MHGAMFRSIVLAVMLGLSCATYCKQTTKKIIKVYPTEVTWDLAKGGCEGWRLLGYGTLVIDDDDETHSFLTAQGKEVWMGGSDTAREGVWKWVNGVGINERDAKWYGGGPNNDNEQDCMVINWNTIGTWDDQSCSNKIMWACQWLLPEGTTMVDGRLVRIQTRKTTAKAACSGAEERLIVANTEAINNWLVTHGPVWIGATDVKHEGQWYWSNGDRLSLKDWMNWKAGGPDDLELAEDCALHLGKDAKWDDRSCDELHAAACELRRTNYCEPSKKRHRYLSAVKS